MVCGSRGNIYLDGVDIYRDIDVIDLRRRVGHGIPAAEPVPEEHL